MDIVDRLLATPNRPERDMPLGNGTTVKVPSIGHSWEDDSLRKEAAEEIKRLRELIQTA